MEIGDEEDCVSRVASVLPTGWLPPSLDDAPVAKSVLRMPASVASWIYSLIDYTKKQTRISTSTDGWLDLTAYDFFGAAMRRRPGQLDDAYRRRILAEILRPRATRLGMEQLILELTGREPVITEPRRPADTGAYRGPRLGYGVAGRYGSLMIPKQVFIDIYRNTSAGIPRVNGYNMPAGGYGVGRSQWSSINSIRGDITDDEILAAVAANKAAGVTVWVRIHV